MYDQYSDCEQFGESSCKSSMRRTEQTAAVNVALDTVCRPCPQRSCPAFHITHHSIQGRAENAELNEEPALNQRSGIVSPTSAGLKNQDLVDQRNLGHWNKIRQGGIHLDSLRFPHPHLSSRLSLYGPDGLLSEVTSRDGAHDAGTAYEHDNLIPLDDHAGDSSLQRCHSTSSSGADCVEDQRGRETHPSFLAILRRRSPESRHRRWRLRHHPKDKLRNQGLEPGQISQP
jgi:hypothetical protein